MWWNFTWAVKSLKFCKFCPFCPNYIKFQLIKYSRVISRDTEVCKVWAKKILRDDILWHWTVMKNFIKPWPCWYKNGMRNWANFHNSTQKSEKLYFHGLFLTKAYVLARKFQRNHVSWHWRVMQNLKENWLVACKMT